MKLCDREYAAVILAESHAAARLPKCSETHAQRAQRFAQLFACAAADEVAVTTAMMNAALSSAASSIPLPLSLVTSILPLPAPPPDSTTLDIVAAAFACAAHADHSDDTSLQSLMQIFQFGRVVFLSHVLPPPTPSTLVSVIKTCMRFHLASLASSIMLTASSHVGDANKSRLPLMSAAACRAFADALRRGVDSKMCVQLIVLRANI